MDDGKFLPVYQCCTQLFVALLAIRIFRIRFKEFMLNPSKILDKEQYDDSSTSCITELN